MLSPLAFKLLHPLWRLMDWLVPKRADYWAFCTHHLHTGRFVENQRALFEQVKAEPTIRKLVFYRGQSDDWQIEGAVNYQAVQHGTFKAFWLLARCKVVLLTHSISMDFSLRWAGGRFAVLKLNTSQRVVVNLWHGIALKRLLQTANSATRQHTDRVPYRTQERRGYAGLIASSDIDSYAMAAMFYPLNYQQIWLTGLPRNDFLTMPEEQLPLYIRDSLDKIRAIKQGKKLIIYAPTYRQIAVSESAYYYQFSAEEIEQLKDFLRSNNAVLGYRPHYFKNSTEFFNLDQYIDHELIFDLSQSAVPEFSALARECDLLLTDYSSVYIEALYLNKPVICFGYDIEHYRSQQDGLLYDIELAFPGPVVEEFTQLIPTVQEKLNTPTQHIEQEQKTAKQLFFKYQDASNSERVIKRIQHLLQNGSA